MIYILLVALFASLVYLCFILARNGMKIEVNNNKFIALTKEHEHVKPKRSNKLVLVLPIVLCLFIALILHNRVDINTASKQQLMELDGIGEKRAELIIKNRPYNSIYDLENVQGLGPAVIENNRLRIKAGWI